MSEHKHTPGPLAMGIDCDSKDLVITNENTIVASVYEKEYGPLFAAAPDMYEALRKISLQLEEMRHMLSDTHAYMRNEMIADIKILLRKARGETE